jgi:uncharacterized protein
VKALVRLGARAVAAPLLGLIWLYQRTLGAAFPNRCRYSPTCSAFADEAIRLNGPIVGVGQTLWRLIRCGPWSSGGVDHPRPARSLARHRSSVH